MLYLLHEIGLMPFIYEGNRPLFFFFFLLSLFNFFLLFIYFNCNERKSLKSLLEKNTVFILFVKKYQEHYLYGPFETER